MDVTTPSIFPENHRGPSPPSPSPAPESVAVGCHHDGVSRGVGLFGAPAVDKCGCSENRLATNAGDRPGRSVCGRRVLVLVLGRRVLGRRVLGQHVFGQQVFGRGILGPVPIGQPQGLGLGATGATILERVGFGPTASGSRVDVCGSGSGRGIPNTSCQDKQVALRIEPVLFRQLPARHSTRCTLNRWSARSTSRSRMATTWPSMA